MATGDIEKGTNRDLSTPRGNDSELRMEFLLPGQILKSFQSDPGYAGLIPLIYKFLENRNLTAEKSNQ